MDLATAKSKAQEFITWLETRPGVSEVAYVGSVRRDDPRVGDVDIFVVASDLVDLKNRLITFCDNREFPWQIATHRREKCFVIDHPSGIGVEIYAVDSTDNIGAKKLWLTGSITHNVKLRLHALKMGYDLTPDGVYDASGSLIPTTTEADIFTALGLTENLPSERSR